MTTSQTDAPTTQERTAAITHHVEPPAQGGMRYLRCHGCGREVIGTDEDRLLHTETCPNR